MSRSAVQVLAEPSRSSCGGGSVGGVGISLFGGVSGGGRSTCSANKLPRPPRPCFSNTVSPSLSGRGDMEPFIDVASSGNIDDSSSSGLHQDDGQHFTGQDQNDRRDDDAKPPAAGTDQERTIEAMIERDLEQLSDEERQRIVQDVNGEEPNSSSSGSSIHSTLSPLVVPTEKLLLSFQLALDRELQTLRMQPNNDDLVGFLSSGFAKDASLRRKMLLAECNDAPAAVQRLIGYLRLLQDILGPKIRRSVSLADFSDRERHFQRKGAMQLFKFRDTHGRRLVGYFESGATHETNLIAELKVMTYLMQSAAEDEASQEKGIVVICMMGKSSTAGTTSHDRNFNPRIDSLIRVLQLSPVRVGAFHVCSPDLPEYYTAKNDLANALNRNLRFRMRLHRGTTMECSSEISRFGIATERLPIKYDGSIKLDDHLQWIAVREAKEEAERQGKSFNVVECPLNMDILAGRGQLIRSHPGNVAFRRDFIHVRMSDYNKAFNRETKNEIADGVLEEIASLKRRFLKQHPTAAYWTELDYKTAKEKVMMAFREYRKVQKSSATAGLVVSATMGAPGTPPQQNYPVQAGRTIVPIIADGFRRPLHSPISISRSNSNIAQPIERQYQSPAGHHRQAYQGAYPEHNAQCHLMGVGAPLYPVYPGTFPYQMLHDPRTAELHPLPFQSPGTPSTSQGRFSDYDIQGQSAGSPQNRQIDPVLGTFHPLQYSGKNRDSYGDHSNDSFDNYSHKR